jgi:hypothetical protein
VSNNVSVYPYNPIAEQDEAARTFRGLLFAFVLAPFAWSLIIVAIVGVLYVAGVR